MEPEFNEADLIIIDQERRPVNGDYVIFEDESGAMFRRLVIDGQTVFLKPLNERYPTRNITGLESGIVGVAVERMTEC